MDEQSINQNIARELPETNAILQEILRVEAIRTDDELRESQLRHSEMYFNPPSDVSEKDVLSVIDREDRRMRMYLTRQVVDFLYSQHPTRLLECGSVGDISAALALPNTQIVSVDSDQNIFLHMPYNLLPREYLEKIGKKKSREYYGGPDLLGRKRKKLELVKNAIPNLNIQVQDANQLTYSDNYFDGVFVQGTPDMFDFLPEMARVVRPNGFIWGIIHEQVKPESAPSVYETRQYNQDTYSDLSPVSDERLREIGLERISTPDRFKNYEKLCVWRDTDGSIKESGFVIDIFKKISDVGHPI